jgi:hypothetical protein
VLDHRAHHGEGGEASRVGRPGERLGPVRVAHGQRLAQPVLRLRVRPDAVQVPLGRELAQEPGERSGRSRRIGLRLEEAADGRPLAKSRSQVELAHQTQQQVHGEAVEVLGAEDEGGGEEGTDVRVRDPRQKLRQLFGARRHAAIVWGPSSPVEGHDPVN